MFRQSDRAQLGRIEDLLFNLTYGVKKAMAALDDAIAKLQADITASTTVEQSAITLLNGIPAMIAAAVAAAQAAGATPAQLASIAAVSAAIEANTPALAAAVTANTPPAKP